jgi:hypothetical protein
METEGVYATPLPVVVVTLREHQAQANQRQEDFCVLAKQLVFCKTLFVTFSVARIATKSTTTSLTVHRQAPNLPFVVIRLLLEDSHTPLSGHAFPRPSSWPITHPHSGLYR